MCPSRRTWAGMRAGASRRSSSLAGHCHSHDTLRTCGKGPGDHATLYSKGAVAQRADISRCQAGRRHQQAGSHRLLLGDATTRCAWPAAKQADGAAQAAMMMGLRPGQPLQHVVAQSLRLRSCGEHGCGPSAEYSKQPPTTRTRHCSRSTTPAHDLSP